MSKDHKPPKPKPVSEFDKLMRGLAAVPKKELLEQERAHKHKSRHRKTKEPQ